MLNGPKTNWSPVGSSILGIAALDSKQSAWITSPRACGRHRKPLLPVRRVLVVLFVSGLSNPLGQGAIACLLPKAVRDPGSLRKNMGWGHSLGASGSTDYGTGYREAYENILGEPRRKEVLGAERAHPKQIQVPTVK